MSDRKYPVRDSGPMYNFPMPTETLRAELAEACEQIKSLKTDVAEARGIVFDLDADLGAAKAQLDAALQLHTPILEGVQGYLPNGDYGYIEPACSTCGNADEYGASWPCDTAKALGVTE